MCIHRNQVTLLPVPNTMRYASSSDKIPNYTSPEQVFDLAETSSLPSQVEPYIGKYRISRSDAEAAHEGRFLDLEDRNLLDKFYRETKATDPFLDDSLSTDSLWDSAWPQNSSGTSALLDLHVDEPTGDNNHDAGWTIDSKLKLIDDKQVPKHQGLAADYSPTHKLLTSYDPVDESIVAAAGAQNNGNRIVGATLYGRGDDVSKPSVSSKSARDAIQLHDELLQKPPKDGTVRVRMYYHRAIHDDVNLYGNGPWKYWGHGWGVEFGYDPKKDSRNKSYQKGYTIERAFGRDFCRDKLHCRKSDPNFFKDPRNVGTYSRQFAKSKPNIKLGNIYYRY